MEKRKLTDEMLAQFAGGSQEEWNELKAWALRHNPKWAGKTIDQVGDGPVVKYLYLEIPEYDGSASKDNGPCDYFVNNAPKRVMNHEEFMALLIERYGY